MQKLLGIFPVEVVVLCIIATISRPLIRVFEIARFKIQIPKHQRGPKTGWRHFVDNDISWTLFFKMGDFSWTFSKGDFSWTILVTSRGQF